MYFTNRVNLLCTITVLFNHYLTIIIIIIFIIITSSQLAC